MSLPIDTDLIPPPRSQSLAVDIDEATQSLTLSDMGDESSYAQLAQRRAQLEDAETLRRVRAL